MAVIGVRYLIAYRKSLDAHTFRYLIDHASDAHRFRYLIRDSWYAHWLHLLFADHHCATKGSDVPVKIQAIRFKTRGGEGSHTFSTHFFISLRSVWLRRRWLAVTSGLCCAEESTTDHSKRVTQRLHPKIETLIITRRCGLRDRTGPCDHRRINGLCDHQRAMRSPPHKRVLQ